MSCLLYLSLGTYEYALCVYFYFDFDSDFAVCGVEWRRGEWRGGNETYAYAYGYAYGANLIRSMDCMYVCRVREGKGREGVLVLGVREKGKERARLGGGRGGNWMVSKELTPYMNECYGLNNN